MMDQKTCQKCNASIPEWWVRCYCANCGNDIPQTPENVEIEQLRCSMRIIYDLTHCCPETLKKEILVLLVQNAFAIADEALKRSDAYKRQ